MVNKTNFFFFSEHILTICLSTFRLTTLRCLAKIQAMPINFQTAERSLFTVIAARSRWSWFVIRYAYPALVYWHFGTIYRQSITVLGIGTIAALIGRKRHLVMTVPRILSADARASDCLCMNNNEVMTHTARSVYIHYSILVLYTAKPVLVKHVSRKRAPNIVGSGYNWLSILHRIICETQGGFNEYSKHLVCLNRQYQVNFSTALCCKTWSVIGGLESPKGRAG